MQKIQLTVDIGGTNIRFALFKGKTLWKQGHFRTSIFKTAKMAVRAIHNFVHKLLTRDESVEGIAVGAPNGNHFTGRVDYAPNLNWGDSIPLVDLFKEAFVCKVVLDNDANLAAIGAYNSLNIQSPEAIVLTLGTGLGAGLFIGGQLHRGQSGFAGELGHCVVEEGGRLCTCGLKGCLETYVSKRGIKQTAAELIGKGVEGFDLSMKNLDIAARSGNYNALDVYEQTTTYLALGLANVITLLDIGDIVLMGGLAQAGDLLTKPLERQLKKQLLPMFQDSWRIHIIEEQNDDIIFTGALGLL